MDNSDHEAYIKCADYVEIKFHKKLFRKKDVTVVTKGIEDIFGLVREFEESSQNKSLQHYINANRDIIYLADGKLLVTDVSNGIHFETNIGVLRWFFEYLDGISDLSRMQIDDFCPDYINLRHQLSSPQTE